MGKIVIDAGELYNPSKNPKQWYAHQVPETYVLYGGAKGGGKTACAVNEAIRLSIEYPGNRGFIGCRNGTDFKRNVLEQLLKFLPPETYASSRGGVHHKSDQYIKLINGSMIFYGGVGDESESELKIHNLGSLGWVVIDQAEQISEHQFLSLSAQLRLPGVKHKMFLTANPDPGWLRKAFIEGELPDSRYIPAMPKDNPFLPTDYADKLREIYPAEMAKRLLEGDWDVPGADVLIPYDQIRAATERSLPASGAAVGGLDVAEFGESSTVFCARQGNRVLDIVSWTHMDTEFSAGKVAELIRKHKLIRLNIDTIGKGGEVYVLLKNDYPVRAVNVSEQASKPDRFINKRAEFYGSLAKRFEMGEISIPDHAQLASQLASLRKKYRQSKLQIESKELMRKRGLKSPDFADALMLSFASDGTKQEISIYRRGRRVR
jgi:hypothetical protein